MNPRASLPLLWLLAVVAALSARSLAADPRSNAPAPIRVAPAVANAEKKPAPVPSLFGLTNVWTLHLVVSPSDWQTMGSRGGPNMGMRFNNGGGQQQSEGILEGIVRGVFGGQPDAPRPRTAPRQAASDDGNSRYPWAHCTVEANGQVLTNVSIRFKGVSSFVRAPSAFKRPFKLDFDRDVDGRKFEGVGEVNLNNNVNDATQMREALAYDLFRKAGIPAPHTAFARVYLTIPGKLEKQNLGLYTMVENVGGEFLKREFGTKKGMLLKPEQMRGLGYLGDDWDNYTERYHPKSEPTPEEASRFIAFVRFIQHADPETFSRRLPDYLDPKAFARFVALNGILANVDSFIGNGHNYFLEVHPDTHKATFVPWDLNESFGVHPVSGPSRDQMRTSILRPNADPNRLVERFVVDPTFGPIYREQCAWLLANVFVPAQLNASIDRIAAVTKPIVMSETRRAREDFERTILQTRKPDDGDTSIPRHDAEFARERYHPGGFPDAVEIDNMPLKVWIAGRHAQTTGELEGRLRGTRPRPRLNNY